MTIAASCRLALKPMFSTRRFSMPCRMSRTWNTPMLSKRLQRASGGSGRGCTSASGRAQNFGRQSQAIGTFQRPGIDDPLSCALTDALVQPRPLPPDARCNRFDSIGVFHVRLIRQGIENRRVENFADKANRQQATIVTDAQVAEQRCGKIVLATGIPVRAKPHHRFHDKPKCTNGATPRVENFGSAQLKEVQAHRHCASVSTKLIQSFQSHESIIACRCHQLTMNPHKP